MVDLWNEKNYKTSWDQFYKSGYPGLEYAETLDIPFVFASNGDGFVFHDKTLKEMAALRPSSRAELLQVGGVGERKAERYGEAFLEAIRGGS